MTILQKGMTQIQQMFSGSGSDSGGERKFGTFAGVFVPTVLTILGAIMYLRTYRTVEEGKAYSRYWGSVVGFGAVAFLVSVFLESPVTYVVWGVALAGILSTPFSRTSRALAEEFPIDMEHLSERYGLLTIIVLGESFVKVLTYLAGLDGGAESTYLMKAALALLVTCCIWWIYFDDVAGAELKERRGSWIIWFIGHLPLAISITAVGVAVKKTLTFDLSATPDVAYGWFLVGSLSLVFFSVAIIDSVTERMNQQINDRWRVSLRFGTAILILILGQVAAGTSAGNFLALLIAACMAQVILDMFMAPFGEGHVEEHTVLTSDLAKAAERGERERSQISRRTIAEVVRRGTPAELRKDIYFFFIEGSWTRLLFTLVFVFGMANVFFAGLYMLDPGSIDGSAAFVSFADAFNFSVQTMSTIGYGTLSPGTSWANLVVTFEAAFGVLGAALATGIMLAKASRPSSSVLFAKNLLLNRFGGKPTLMFRAANARGNEIVEASVTLSVLIEEVTPEGQHLRRVHDLELVRDRSPMFSMTWLIMHVVDENSPLEDVDWDSPEKTVMGFIVTMLGFDGTLGQQTHARHMYLPSDLRVNDEYQDVLGELPDGRLVIDLTNFHDTRPSEMPLEFDENGRLARLANEPEIDSSPMPDEEE